MAAHARTGLRLPWGLTPRRVVRELVVLVVIVAVATSLKKLHLLYPVERFLIDLFAVTEPTAAARHTALIDIDDDSYNGPYFESISPIKKDRLAELIWAAASGGSKVVVVDIDTDSSAVLTELKKLKDARPIPDVPVVWAVAGYECGHTGCVVPSRDLAATGESGRQHFGLAMLLHDGDGVLRRYRAAFPMARVVSKDRCECTSEPGPTLARVAAVTYQPGLPERSEEPLTLNWRGDRLFSPRFPASRVLDGRDKEWWPKAADPMRGKLTLIGGTFSAARDTRRTPSGEMAGVEVLAHIIETELNGGGMEPYSFKAGIALEFVCGLALIIVNLAFKSASRRRLLANALMVFAVPLLGSWLMYRFSFYWVNLAPVIAGVTLHQWYERAHSLVPAGPAHHHV